MPKRTFIAGLFVVVLLLSSVQAVTVKRGRHIREQTNIKELFSSIARGLGYRLGEEPNQDELAGLKEKVKQLGLKFEFMNVTLRDDQGNEQEFSVQEIDGVYQIVLGAPKGDFDVTKVRHVSQKSRVWATVRGYRIHFQQDLEYNRAGRFVRLDLKVLNSIGRVNGLDFYAALYEEETHQTDIETGMTVSARVPNCRLIRRIARRKITDESDKVLFTLDQKVREIVRESDQGSWLELVPLLAKRAVAGLP